MASSFPNGPGDPEPCDYRFARSASPASATPSSASASGTQLLGLATAPRRQDEVRHHGATSRCRIWTPGASFITSQNHGFRGRREDAAANVRARTAPLRRHAPGASSSPTSPLNSFQGHPEASPGSARSGRTCSTSFVRMMEKGGMKHRGAQRRTEKRRCERIISHSRTGND